MRALIVDDERPARLRLRRLLAAHEDVEIAGEAANAAEARAMIRAQHPDVVFLDVQMPGESGFDLLASIAKDDARPHIVFVTAFDAYAVRAFEEEALDYLLKPFRPERLAQALDRARRATSEDATSHDAGTDARIEKLLERLEAAASRDAVRAAPSEGLPYIDRLTARVGERVDVIPVRDILYFRAEDKYVVAYTARGSHVLNLTLDQLESELDPTRFTRTHRSVVVSLDAVVSVESGFAGTYALRLRGTDADVPVSRQRAKALRTRLRF